MRRSENTEQPARLTQLLREQLHEMMAAAQMLAPALAGSRKGLDYLAVLNRGLCRQLRLVRQLELENRLNDPDEIRLDRTLVDLVPLCRSLIDRVGSLMPALDIRTDFTTSLTTLPTLADQGALEEMLLALISNAVKAIGRDGTIRLELARQQDKAVFTLTDSGGGMDAGALAGLFDSPAEDSGGEGDDGQAACPARGLHLVQQIAALHGGILIADSQENRGARLAVSIPLLDRPAGTLHSARLPIDSMGGWDRVLVALSDCLPAQVYLPQAPDR